MDFYNVTKHGELYHELTSVHHCIVILSIYYKNIKSIQVVSRLVRNIFEDGSARPRYSLYDI